MSRAPVFFGSHDWAERSRCQDLSPDVADAYFFPAQGQRQPAAAKLMCKGCPVKVECEAAGRDEEYGYWGSTKSVPHSGAAA